MRRWRSVVTAGVYFGGLLLLPQGVFAQRPAATLPPPPVYVEDFFGSLSLAQSGNARYATRRTPMGGYRYEHSLVTEVTNQRPEERASTLTLFLAGRYETFFATVGRDDDAARNGPGAVAFEVWGDEKRLYQSPPLTASRNRPRILSSAGTQVLHSPQELTVPVSGVRLLRLVTRYASDIPQSGNLANRAKGCAWGDARLTPGKRGRPDDALREALRAAAAQLTARLTALNLSGNLGSASKPLRVTIAPLSAASVLTQGGEFAAPAEPTLRMALRLFLASARRGEEPLFVVSNARDEGRLPLLGAPRDDATDQVLMQAGQKIGVDIIITGVYDWSVAAPIALYAVEMREGKRIGPIGSGAGAGVQAAEVK